MNRMKNAMAGLRGLGILAALVALATAYTACSTAPTPFVIRGPGNTDNEPPTLTITEPNANVTIGQGNRFLVSWTDSDRDTNASIGFFFVSTATNRRISLVQGIDENDINGSDSVSIGTSPVPEETYYLLGVIDDGINPQAESYALIEGTTTAQRVEISVVEPGTQPPTQPPIVTVTLPVFNLSVAEEDTLSIAVQPTPQVPGENTPPFDNDSEVRLFILLDTDLDPNNDDPANDVPGTADGIIVLQQTTLPAGNNGAVQFNINVDLRTIPSRPDGEPYFVRATADDLTNPRVHQYASGKISVVQLAAGSVDLFDIGRTKAGATWYGFSPGANTGSSMSSIGDFDADGVSDFILVAQKGNPRNFGLIGEAYLVYGLNGVRFGGRIPVNSISESVSGVIFEAPPVRLSPDDVLIPTPNPARSDGITSVSLLRDVTGDNRPELLIGMAHVHSAFESMDYDPGDETATDEDEEEVVVTFAQGRTTTQIGDGAEFESQFYSGVEDVTISSATPSNSAGSSAELTWRDDPGANVQEFTLIKFKDILPNIPDTNTLFLIDETSVDAQLEFRVVNVGGAANLHQTFTDFDEQTTFNTFGGGGVPVAGVDYGEIAIGNIDSSAAQTVMVDVSDFVVQLINGVLEADDHELRFILVPNAADSADQAGVRSSEFSQVLSRPRLSITYSRFNIFGALGCYSDDLVNNFTDPDSARRDWTFFGGGMAVMVNSQNRDNSGLVNENRLESTVVSLELVGQEANVALDGSGFNQAAGGIFARAEDPSEEDRIAGARFTPGGFDYWDHLFLRQGPREDLFGQTVASIGDLNNDGFDEILISAPRNERYLQDLLDSFGFQSTHYNSTIFQGSIVVLPGANYNSTFWRDTTGEGDSVTTIPILDQQRFPEFGSCSSGVPREYRYPADSFNVFAEDIDDMLGGAVSAGDFNQDGLDDILCGGPMNNRGDLENTGAAYVLYGRNVLGDFRLENANNALLRTPMLRIRGVKSGDQVGWKQSSGLDVNGDRIDDVFVAAPRADFGGVSRSSCGGDFDRDGVVDTDDFSSTNFETCRSRFRRPDQDLFSDDACKVFDYDNDDDIDDDDERVVDCLRDARSNCCENLVDNGFVGVIFGGVFTDGDRDITQLASSDLQGTVFFGSGAGHRAGFDVSSAGDFNQDGFGDILIVVPGETRLDRSSRQRVGVVYLVFGGTYLTNTKWSLSQVGTDDLPGIVFLSPYAKGRPNEAPPSSVAFLGDINNDGFGDIAIGNPKADFIDLSFPQGPNAPSGDAAVGRRRNAGDSYMVYGNNFGTNRGRR